MGYPALEPDPQGAPVEVDVLSSDELPAHWARLDAFEGAGYRRVQVQVLCEGGVTLTAQLYALQRESS